METITRSQFRQAVRHGILCSPSLSTDECRRLNAVARSATSFGDNFDAGCPADLAGLCSGPGPVSSAIATFARYFDSAIGKLHRKWGYIERIRVTD